MGSLYLNKSIQLEPGNFFKDDFPRNIDGVLFSNIFHDWQLCQALFLAKKAYSSLAEGGTIFINEMLLNKNKSGPLNAIVFNLLMYINQGSQQYTQREIYVILEEAEFRNCQRHLTHPYYNVITDKKV